MKPNPYFRKQVQMEQGIDSFETFLLIFRIILTIILLIAIIYYILVLA